MRNGGPILVQATGMAMAGACLLGLGFMTSEAKAGSGPWVISPRELSLYAGLESQRISELALADGLNHPSVIPVDDGIQTLGGTLIASYGLRKRIEIEGTLPWSRVEAVRPGGAVCASLGPKSCAQTVGVGVLSGRVKGLLLDEVSGAPLSLAVGSELRFGQLTADTRKRVTNLGEGTTDVGAFMAVGRSGSLKEGYWSAHVDGTYRYRFSNVPDADPGVPAPEFVIDGELLAGARPWWSLGPSASWWERPGGVDFGEGDLGDIDRFGRLNGRSVRVGGKALLRASSRTTVVFSALRTVAARNNPRVTVVGAGIALYPERRDNKAEK
jgi:hypothetical protein